MMAKIERFEDVVAWQLARDLVNAVYSATKEEQFTKDFGLRDQIRRASISVMANIAEGFDAGSDAELVRFLRYSLRSPRKHNLIYTPPWIKITSIPKFLINFTNWLVVQR